MNLHFREISAADYSFLREYLYLAIYVPPGEEPLEESVIDLPEISKYIKGWKDYRDFGLICFSNEEPLGAIWGRLFCADNKGYGFVDAVTPELTMAIKEHYRNQGLGSMLMQQFFEMAIRKGFKNISLSVDKRNRAFGFYERNGFSVIGETQTSFSMIRQL